MFNIVVGVIMGVAFVGMIVCAKKQNSTPAAKPAALGLLVAVVISAIAMLVHNLGGGADNEVIATEAQYTASTAYTLAKHLSHTMPGAKVLVVTSKVDKSNILQQAKIKALKEGLAPATTDVVFDVPPVSDPSVSAIMNSLTAADMDKLFAKHKDRNLIIMLIRLPRDAQKMKIWSQFLKDKKKTPKLALLFDSISSLGGFIQSGLIVGAVVTSPEYHYVDGAPAPKSYDEAFKKRYLLITPKNVVAMSKKYPKLFPKKRGHRR